MRERAILVTLDFVSMCRDWVPRDAAEELAELSRSAGLLVAENLVWRQRDPNAPLLLGRGKAQELAEIVRDEKADVVVFNSSLSSSQQRNLEDILNVKTIDRTQLILDIFALRARSAEGKLQVELAQLKYLLPRLSGKGIFLSRLGGGVGTRGPGEQKLEVDRRRIRERITRLGRELARLDERRLAGISRKREKNLPLVALVGYTNAGKTSLFNSLTDASKLVKDQLFSTLDTTTRLLELPHNQKALLVDTVGFIRDLPHHLIESFKATLEEAVHADILLHVVDASRSDLPILERSVEEVLRYLGALEKKTLLVFNKADKLKKEEKELFLKRNGHGSALLSALTGEGVEGLLASLSRELGQGRQIREFYVLKEHARLIGYLYEEGEVMERRDDAGGVFLRVHLTRQAESQFNSKLNQSLNRDRKFPENS